MVTHTNHIANRLQIMQAKAKVGSLPTVAQISATYCSMAMGSYNENHWQQLLQLAKQATGVTVVCVGCGPSHTVPATAGHRENGQTRMPCPDCNGIGKRVIHKPAPGELPGNIGQAKAGQTLMQQVMAALSVC